MVLRLKKFSIEVNDLDYLKYFIFLEDMKKNVQFFGTLFKNEK